MINRFANVKTPVGLGELESECRYRMSEQLTLKGWI